MSDDDRLRQVLRGTWAQLNDRVFALSEEELQRLLALEVEEQLLKPKSQRRLMFSLRIHSRLNHLRRERERVALCLQLGFKDQAQRMKVADA